MSRPRVSSVLSTTVAAGALALGGLVAAPAEAGVVDSWDELRQAFDDAASGAVITLGADIPRNEAGQHLAVPGGVVVTLDLNGHDLTIGGDGHEVDGSVAAIHVPGDATFTIRDTHPGKNRLAVTGGSGHDPMESGGAGIGGNSDFADGIDGDAGGGTVLIESGTVRATGGYQAAGIGGGHMGQAGLVVVDRGASVSATGGDSGAGIGGGFYGGGDKVVIEAGAEVTAKGGGVGVSAVGPGRSFGGTTRLDLTNNGELRLPQDARLWIRSGAVVRNHGTIHNDGTIDGDGTLINRGSIRNGPHAHIPGDGQGGTGHVRVDGNNFTVGFGPGHGDAHVYARSFKAAGIALPDPPGGSWWGIAATGTRVFPDSGLRALVGVGPANLALVALPVTDPAITAKVKPGKPRKKHHGWYRSKKVRVVFSCTAGSAPVVQCPKAKTIRANGVHHVKRKVRAKDGGSATVRVTVRLDHKKPRLRVRGVKRHRTYQHQPRIRCRVSDKHSGVQKVHGKRCRVKRHRVKGHKWKFVVTARDRAANKVRRAGTYRVR